MQSPGPATKVAGALEEERGPLSFDQALMDSFYRLKRGADGYSVSDLWHSVAERQEAIGQALKNGCTGSASLLREVRLTDAAPLARSPMRIAAFELSREGRTADGREKSVRFYEVLTSKNQKYPIAFLVALGTLADPRASDVVMGFGPDGKQIFHRVLRPEE